MQESSIRNRFVLAVLVAPLLSGCIGWIGGPISESQVKNPTIETAQGTEPLADRQASVVHIDPRTGQIVVPPPVASSGQTQQPQINTPMMPPLQETVSPSPGGGVMIHLDERFLTPLTATIDEDGKLRIGHHSPTANSSDKK